MLRSRGAGRVRAVVLVGFVIGVTAVLAVRVLRLGPLPQIQPPTLAVGEPLSRLAIDVDAAQFSRQPPLRLRSRQPQTPRLVEIPSAPIAEATMATQFELTLPPFEFGARMEAPIRTRDGGFQSVLPVDAPQVSSSPAWFRRPSPMRGSMTAMYLAYGTLQVLDVHSTLRAVGAGAVEANPLVRPIVSTPAGLISLKAASALGTVYLVERLRKRNPTAAFAFAVGVNSLYTIAVVHNYRVGTRMARRRLP